MTKDEISAKLDELGIEHDKRLAKDKLEALLPEGEMPVPEQPGIECIVMRDFWDSEGERHRKGSAERFTVEEALDGVESGALKRVKG